MVPRAMDSSACWLEVRGWGSPDEPTFGVRSGGGTGDCPGPDANEDVSALAGVDEDKRAGCPQPPADALAPNELPWTPHHPPLPA